MTRPRNYTIAAILQALMSLVAIVMALTFLPQGSAGLDGTEGPGYGFILLFGLFLPMLGLFGAFGVWRMQKWGVVLTIITRALDGLGAAPGVIFAPDLSWRIAAISSVVVAILVIALLLWPQTRSNPAMSQTQ
ncbi:MAG: hypothetical protein AB4911_13020 [Oscillochloridaceae bacterium umkhey_bin13]